MFKIKLLVLLMAAGILLPSCKGDKEEETPQTSSPDYTQLNVGNYWVYQRFENDGSGNITSLNKFDSIYVEKDTTINSNTYYKVFKPGLVSSLDRFIYLRDSLHYIVDKFGIIQFSYQDFATVFGSYYITASPIDTITFIESKMQSGTTVVTVPTGTYTTLNSRRTYNMWPKWSGNGSKRFVDIQYATGIGVVRETLDFYQSLPKQEERRLIRYNLN